MTENNNIQQQLSSGIGKYWQVVASAIIAAIAVGKAFSMLEVMEKQFQSRQAAYDKMEDRVIKLEEAAAYEKGYHQAEKDFKVHTHDKP